MAVVRFARQQAAVVVKNCKIERKTPAQVLTNLLLPVYILGMLALVRYFTPGEAATDLTFPSPTSDAERLQARINQAVALDPRVVPELLWCCCCEAHECELEACNVTRGAFASALTPAPLLVRPVWSASEAAARFHDSPSRVLGAVLASVPSRERASITPPKITLRFGGADLERAVAIAQTPHGTTDDDDLVASAYLETGLLAVLRAVFEAVQDGGVAWPPQIFQQYPTKITSLARAYSSVDSLFAAVPLMVVIAMSRGASGLCARVALERHRKQSLVMRTLGLSENAQRLAWLSTYSVVQGVAALLAVLTATFRSGLFAAASRVSLFVLFVMFNSALGAMSLAVAAIVPSPKTAGTIAAIVPIIVAVSDEFLRRNPGGDASGSSIASTTAWLVLAPSTFARAIAAAVRLEALKIAVPNPFELLRYLARARAPVIVSAAASESAEDNIAVIAMAVLLLALHTLVYLALGAFLGAVLPDEFGERRLTLSTFKFHQTAGLNLHANACVRSIRSAWRLRVPSRDDDHEATASGDNDNEAHEATSRNPLQTELVPLAQAPMQDQNDCVSVSLCHVHKQFEAPPCSRAKRIASDEKCALRGFSLEVLEGETVVLLGPNGAGKSTAIAVMLGLVSPSSGLVHALGIPVPSRAAELRARTGVCPQSASLFDELSVDDHLALAAGIRALPSRTARARGRGLVAQLGLSQASRAKPVGKLSGGQKQMLLVALALLSEPELIVCDEPTAGMVSWRARLFACES